MKNPLGHAPKWMQTTVYGTLILIFAAIFVPAALQTFGAGLRGEFNKPADKRHSVPLCSSEDGSEHRVCYWDAKKQGNGEGRSFTSYNFGEFVVFNDTLTVESGEDIGNG